MPKPSKQQHASELKYFGKTKQKSIQNGKNNFFFYVTNTSFVKQGFQNFNLFIPLSFILYQNNIKSLSIFGLVTKKRNFDLYNFWTMMSKKNFRFSNMHVKIEGPRGRENLKLEKP